MEALAGEQAGVAEETVRVRLKWFNSTKGFGFVIPEEDPCDAFIHITTLQDAGIHELGEEALLLCRLVISPKGALITQVEELIDIGENPVATSYRIQSDDEEVIEDMTGTVKWYKPDKGFGFIIPEDGMKDVFVHKTCLEKQGLGTLIPGQAVMMKVRSVAKGREVIEFELLDHAREAG